MFAPPSLSIDIALHAPPMPIIGIAVVALPFWVDLPLEAAGLVGFLIAFRLRVRLVRHPSQV